MIVYLFHSGSNLEINHMNGLLTSTVWLSLKKVNFNSRSCINCNTENTPATNKKNTYSVLLIIGNAEDVYSKTGLISKRSCMVPMHLILLLLAESPV